MNANILTKTLIFAVVFLLCIALIPNALSAPSKSGNNGKSSIIPSSWDTSLDGWSMCETYYSIPTPGVGIVGSDSNQLSLRGVGPGDTVTLYRNAYMTPSDTFQVSVYNCIWSQEEWHLNAIRIGCNVYGEGIVNQWWGDIYPSAWGPWERTGIRSIDWTLPQVNADMWILPHGQWYDIKMVCNKGYVTSYYKLSSDTAWTLVSSDPIGDNWKGGYISVSGNYHGAYYKDFQIYRTKDR